MAQVKKIAVRDAIVESAYRLFRAKGYSGTSMADIGKAARVAPSNLYVYFDSKFEIFYAVYEPWLKKRLTRLQRQLEKISDPQKRLRRIVEAVWLEFPSEDNGFANNLMQAVSTASRDEKYRSDLLARAEAIISDLLRTSLPQARSGIIDKGRLAHILLMAFDGFVVRYHLRANRKDMDAIVGIMANLIAGTPQAGRGRAARTSGRRRSAPAVRQTATGRQVAPVHK